MKKLRLRRRVGSILLRAICLPTDIAGWLFVLLMHLCWGRRGSLHMRDGIVVAELKMGSWPARTWFSGWAGVAIGHAVLFGPGRARERTWAHERVHVDQCEAVHCGTLLAAGAALALGAPLLAAAAVWALGYAVLILGGLAGAWLRGSDAYYGSVVERAAYAIDGSSEDVDITRRSGRPLLRS